MMQVIEQTFDEKFQMYKKCKKKTLIKMLIECNRILNNIPISAATIVNNARAKQQDTTYAVNGFITYTI